MAYENGEHATRAMADLIKKQVVSSVKNTSPFGRIKKKNKKKQTKK